MPTVNDNLYPSTPGLTLGRTDQEWTAVLTPNSTVGGLATATVTAVPETAISPGVAGSIAFDEGFLYVCVATNTWRRCVIASF